MMMMVMVVGCDDGVGGHKARAAGGGRVLPCHYV